MLLKLAAISVLVMLYVVLSRINFKFTRAYVFWLILISLLPLLSMLRLGVFENGDFATHLTFVQSFADSVKSGVANPRWSENFCGGYGAPLFQYFYKFSYYVILIIQALGISYISSLKLLFSGWFLLSGIGMYFWLKQAYGDKAACIGALLYVFSPYQLAGLHFKGALGESAAFAIAPWIFYLTYKYVVNTRHKFVHLLLLTILTVLILLAHHIVPLFTLAFAMVYAAILLFHYKKTWNDFLFFLGAVALGAGVISYHLAPLLLEGSLVQQSHAREMISFPWWSYLYSPWRFGLLFQGPYAEIPPLIGYAQLATLLFGIYTLCKTKLSRIDRSLLMVGIVGCGLLYIIMQSFFVPVLTALPILQNFQTTSRFMFLLIVLTSMSSAILVKNLHKLDLIQKLPTFLKTHFILFFGGFAVLSTILNWGNRGTIPSITDDIAKSAIYGRCDPQVLPVTFPHTSVPLERVQNIQIVRGSAAVKEISRSPERHAYHITVVEPTVFQENTAYFPNWSVSLNGVIQPKSFLQPNQHGIMEFQLNPGEYELMLVYEDSGIEIWGKRISIISVTIFVGLVLGYVLNKSARKKKKHRE